MPRHCEAICRGGRVIRIRTSKRQNAKERRMERRVYAHPAGRVRVIARRVSYPTAVREVRECRELRPDLRFVYWPSVSNGYNVAELEAK
jgi:hypothetical protein